MCSVPEILLFPFAFFMSDFPLSVASSENCPGSLTELFKSVPLLCQLGGICQCHVGLRYQVGDNQRFLPSTLAAISLSMSERKGTYK